ncbi:TPA: hypothetical protein N0F65_010942 [Lagenidium giganteum]|uniref:Uncharacterized protein n=1 Tax=Lagenidium giganteum TaxID=4803 RepID=A0AAV2YZR0_9STRA|nr:TPA: hypothetical protein N0F65_010942 [Lagenidium giganteum]
MPGLPGSLDCAHWRWRNCPTAWQGHYRGISGAPTVVLEAIATAGRWIWHALFWYSRIQQRPKPQYPNFRSSLLYAILFRRRHLPDVGSFRFSILGTVR